MAVAGSTERWLPIESNPEVINSFLRKLGVPSDWEVNDVYGLEPELLLMLPQPVLGLMLLFPINEQYRAHAANEDSMACQDVPMNLYYMKQTVSNACGTVALVHCLANAYSTGRLKLMPSSPLAVFLSETAGSSPEERAVKLENNEEIVRVHDLAAKEGQTVAPNRDEKVDYHFVALVEVDGHLYQLDGRRKGPIDCGVCSQENFLNLAAAVCKDYMARDPNNLHFTVLALTAKKDD